MILDVSYRQLSHLFIRSLSSRAIGALRIPESLYKLPNLTALAIGYGVTSLPSDFHLFSQITTLDLSWANFESFSTSLSRMSNLTSLFGVKMCNTSEFGTLSDIIYVPSFVQITWLFKFIHERINDSVAAKADKNRRCWRRTRQYPRGSLQHQSSP
jgi:hypothetical protein